MPDWVLQHRASIQFVIWTVVGLLLIVAGVVTHNDPALVALGAGAIGLPGFHAATGEGDGSS